MLSGISAKRFCRQVRHSEFTKPDARGEAGNALLSRPSVRSLPTANCVGDKTPDAAIKVQVFGLRNIRGIVEMREQLLLSDGCGVLMGHVAADRPTGIQPLFEAAFVSKARAYRSRHPSTSRSSRGNSTNLCATHHISLSIHRSSPSYRKLS
jgi:hypothetical protein